MGKNAKIIRVVNGLAFSMVTVFEDIFQKSMFLGMFFRSRHNLHPSQETYPDVENFPYLVQYFHPATFRPQKV